jgi:hypothetical protein
MSWHYEPIARQRFLIRCLGAQPNWNQPCAFSNDDIESPGKAERLANNHINFEDSAGNTPNQDHTVVITPVIMVSRHID